MNGIPTFITYALGTFLWLLASLVVLVITGVAYQWIVDRVYDYRQWRNRK